MLFNPFERISFGEIRAVLVILPDVCLFEAEGLAVGALIHSRICFVCADLNTFQIAVILGFAMVCALTYAAANTFIGGIAARMTTFVFHESTSGRSIFVRDRT